MKRLILAVTALSFLAVPMAYAQSPDGHDSRHHMQHNTIMKKKVVVKRRWERGGRIPHGQHYVVVSDYQHYHLRRPPRGQHWVRVDNQYLLVGITSGIIAALATAH
jgi:Ni/Co efflux regulator RcnB